MKRFTPDQIVSKLRQADVLLGRGLSVKQVCRKIVADQRIDMEILKEAIDISAKNL